ncbi:MAG: hypothetical protein P8170_19420 [Gemmatimonadota bacterium]
MKTASLVLSSVVVAVLGVGLARAPVSAQFIGLRTVPLAAGDQFLIFPASNLGMGGVSIALDDVLLDPYSNPARGARSTGSRFVSSPTSYTVSNDNGGARTMPVGVQLTGDRWFGGVLVALQDLDQGRALGRWLPPMDVGAPAVPRADALAVRSTTNRFAHLSLGRRLGDRWAVAASAMFADLNGTDGVEQLFANAWDIEESGGVRDYRIGLLGTLGGGRSLEAAFVYNHYRMTHDVTSVTWELTDSVLWLFTPDVQRESHRNTSKTWGAHVRYVQPIEGTPWRAGGILTVNRKDHPKIPTYDLTAVEIASRPPIPRDPGNSWAVNVGGGMAYEEGPTTFAVDVVFEPAVSDTWADDVVDVIAADGSVIPPGGHTVDNHFEFSNAHAGMGLSREIGERWAVQLGVRKRSYSYRMEQKDYVLGLERSLTQQWTEWTPTWGASFELNGIEVRYVGLASSASHFPFPSLSFREDDVVFAAPEMGDVLAPPAGLVATPDETVVTHRIQVSVPIR